jgi:hypothetical protein
MLIHLWVAEDTYWCLRLELFGWCFEALLWLWWVGWLGLIRARVLEVFGGVVRERAVGFKFLGGINLNLSDETRSLWAILVFHLLVEV